MIDLDDLLPNATVRTHHRRSSEVSVAETWEAACALRLSDTRRLRRLVHWRLPDTPSDCSFRDLFRTHPFTVLDEGPRHSVSGLAGRLWSIGTDYSELDGLDGFEAWDEAGTVRVLFATWAHERSDGRAELCQEVRIKPTNRSAALRLRVLWTAVGRFEGLIGAEALSQALRNARGQSAQPAS